MVASIREETTGAPSYSWRSERRQFPDPALSAPRPTPGPPPTRPSLPLRSLPPPSNPCLHPYPPPPNRQAAAQTATFGGGNTPSRHGFLKSKDSEGTQLVSGLCLRGWGGVTQGQGGGGIMHVHNCA